MEKKYVIFSLIETGYFEFYTKRFRGILYATQFGSVDAAEEIVKKCDLKNVTIIEMYI